MSKNSYVVMAIRRSTDPVYLQYIWNTIEAAPSHGISTNFQSLLDFIQTNYDQKCTAAKLERELVNAMTDGCLSLEQRMYRSVNLASVKKDTHDWYCFECHGPGCVMPCPTCHRVYHRECLSRANETHWAVRLPTEDHTLSATSDMKVQPVSPSNSLPSHPCPVCQRLNRVDKTKTSLSDLQCIFSAAFDSIRNKAQWKTMQKVGYLYEPLRNEVLVYSQVNTRIIGERMRADPRSSDGYSSRTSLLVHLDDLVHNTTIFYGSKDIMSNTARQVRSQLLREMRESAYCIDCYMRPSSTARLTQACRVPHLLIWYQHNGWSFRPCKVLYESKEGFEVVCFGGRHEREFVSRNRAVDISFTVMDLGLRLTPSLKKALDETEEYKANQGAYNMKQPINGADSYGVSSLKLGTSNKESQPLPTKLGTNSVSPHSRKRKASAAQNVRERQPKLFLSHRTDECSSVATAKINKRRKMPESQSSRLPSSLTDKRAFLFGADFGSKQKCTTDNGFSSSEERGLNHNAHLSSDDDTLMDSLNSETSDTEDVIRGNRGHNPSTWQSHSTEKEGVQQPTSNSPSLVSCRLSTLSNPVNSADRTTKRDSPVGSTCKRIVSPVRIQCDNSMVARLVKPLVPMNTSTSSSSSSPISSSSESDSDAGDTFVRDGAVHDSRAGLQASPRSSSRRNVIRIKPLPPLRPSASTDQSVGLRSGAGKPPPGGGHPHSASSTACTTTVRPTPQDDVNKASSPSTSSSTSSSSSARSSSQLTVPAVVEESMSSGRAYYDPVTSGAGSRKFKSAAVTSGHSSTGVYDSQLMAKSLPLAHVSHPKSHDPSASPHISSTMTSAPRRGKSSSNKVFPSTSSTISSDLHSPSSLSSVSTVSSPSSPSSSSISSSSCSSSSECDRESAKKKPLQSKIRCRRLRAAASSRQQTTAKCNPAYPSRLAVSPTASTLSSASSISISNDVAEVNSPGVELKRLRHSYPVFRRHRVSSVLKSSKCKNAPVSTTPAQHQQPTSVPAQSVSKSRPTVGDCTTTASSPNASGSTSVLLGATKTIGASPVPQSNSTTARGSTRPPCPTTMTTTAVSTTTSSAAMSAPSSGRSQKTSTNTTTVARRGLLSRSTTTTGPTPPLLSSSSSAGSSAYSVSPTGLSTTSGLGSSLCDSKSVDASPAELAAGGNGITATPGPAAANTTTTCGAASRADTRTLEESMQRMHEQLVQVTRERDTAREEVKRREALISQLRSEHVDELRRCKQQTWCNFCLSEAFYHCCPGTAYCSENCQLKHWAAQHNRDCRRRGETVSQQQQQQPSRV